MQEPKYLNCELCGVESPVVMLIGQDSTGGPTQWGKCSMRGESLYVFISCPNCGEREQRVENDEELVD